MKIKIEYNNSIDLLVKNSLKELRSKFKRYNITGKNAKLGYRLKKDGLIIEFSNGANIKIHYIGGFFLKTLVAEIYLPLNIIARDINKKFILKLELYDGNNNRFILFNIFAELMNILDDEEIDL